MPVEADQLAIINAALVLIGDEPLTSLADEGEASDLANLLYEIRLAEAIGMARWRFATRQVVLVINGTAPLARWDYAYDLPDGVTDPVPQTILAVLADDVIIPFDRYENQIFCNYGSTSEIVLDYSFRAAEADFTGRFKSGFVDTLASDFALAKDVEKATALARQAQGKFKGAASLDAQERTSRKLPVQRFINGRRGWGAGRSNRAVGFSGGSNTVSDANYGEITVASGVWTLNDDVLGVEHFANATAGDILIYGAGGVAELLAAGTAGYVLTMSGGLPVWAASGLTLGDADYGDVTIAGGVWTIDAGVVTLAKMADMATASFLGRTTAATGVPEVLTATQATALLNAFTSTLKGLVPLSGGGTSNFLRADGSWAAPATGSSLAWETVSTFYDFTIDGAVASVETPAFAAGYDYRVELVDISPSVTANINVTAYEDGAVAYDAATAKIANGVTAAGASSGMVYIEEPKTARNSHLFWGATDDIDNSTDQVIAVARHSGGTDTIGKLKIALSTGTIDGGSMILYRRAH